MLVLEGFCGAGARRREGRSGVRRVRSRPGAAWGACTGALGADPRPGSGAEGCGGAGVGSGATGRRRSYIEFLNVNFRSQRFLSVF